ncbi:hypothetical protein J2T11_003748 [Paenarthrobacter nicotinovorans]|uniref:hypothetical protein n=1 Tax=Paenarthrobacter nicotinovorans TaxID=29320 RepID=UPI002787707F|nr:hypothetical protein [Paenarthrobacter nicotinovorans]MDP9937377.1 hypothetical protein [Paenarthrobacter nicotinovorans]
MFECDCGRTPPEGYEFCGCGQPVPRDNASGPSTCSPTLGDNFDGVQAGRDVIADRIVFGKDPSDPFDIRMPIDRVSKKKSILPDNWLAAAAATCTILSFILTSILPASVRTGWILLLAGLALLGALVLLAWFCSSFLLAPGQVFVNGFGIYEKSRDGTVYVTQIEGECPWCASNGRYSRMPLRYVDKKPLWVCSAFPAHHKGEFDPSSVAPLED